MIINILIRYLFLTRIHKFIKNNIFFRYSMFKIPTDSIDKNVFYRHVFVLLNQLCTASHCVTNYNNKVSWQTYDGYLYMYPSYCGLRRFFMYTITFTSNTVCGKLFCNSYSFIKHLNMYSVLKILNRISYILIFCGS